jgi:hypothetical protein
MAVFDESIGLAQDCANAVIGHPCPDLPDPAIIQDSLEPEDLTDARQTHPQCHHV